jgi:hypothetical protein
MWGEDTGLADQVIENDMRTRILRWHALVILPIGVLTELIVFIGATASGGHAVTPSTLLEAFGVALPTTACFAIVAGNSFYQRAPPRLEFDGVELHYDGVRLRPRPFRRVSLSLPLTGIQIVGRPFMGGASVIGLARLEGGPGELARPYRDWIMLSSEALDQLGLHTNRRYSDGHELGPLT